MKNLIWLLLPFILGCAHRIDPKNLRLSGREDIEVTPSQKLTTPKLVKGTLADLSQIKEEKRGEILMQFLQENTEIFQIQAPESELRLLRSEDDELGFTHYRYARLIKEVPVFGDELILHVNNKDQLYMVNGEYHPSVVIKTDPAITAEQAGAIALEKGAAHNMKAVDKTGLVFYPVEGKLHLAWEVVLSAGMNKWVYFVDAVDSSVLFDQDMRRF